MKAIVNVSKGSAYSKYNLLTFDVLSNLISLNIQGKTVDFQHKEVIIVDIEEEFKKAFNQRGASKEACVLLYNLRTYKENNFIK